MNDTDTMLETGDKFQVHLGAQASTWGLPDGLDDGEVFVVTKTLKRDGEWVYELRNLGNNERFAHYADDVDPLVASDELCGNCSGLAPKANTLTGKCDTCVGWESN